MIWNIVLSALSIAQQARSEAETSCDPRFRPDTAFVVAAARRLIGGESPRESQVEFNYAGVDGRQRCRTAIAIRWDGGNGGGLVVTDSSGVVEFEQEYDDIGHMRPLGLDRVLFEYRSGRSAGFIERRLVALCSLGTTAWFACLDLEASRTEAVRTGSYSEGREGLEYEARNVVESVSDSAVRIARRLRWRRFHGDSVTTWRAHDLGTITLRLP